MVLYMKQAEGMKMMPPAMARFVLESTQRYTSVQIRAREIGGSAGGSRDPRGRFWTFF